MTILKEEILRKNENPGEVVIDLQNVGKKYIVHHEKPTLAEDVERKLRFQKREKYWALREVNLQICEGEKVGFYGPNGTGKTTLLKIISGISTPTEGLVKTKGRIISLIDLEAGFHPDLTGQENIFLSGLIIGMPKKEIESKFSKIVEFSGLGNFITAPLYMYSSGMKLRLGFSVALHGKPNILLLDEVMNMGDEEFRRNAWKSLNKMFKKKITVLMVSQWLEFLHDNCDRLIELKKSK